MVYQLWCNGGNLRRTRQHLFKGRKRTSADRIRIQKKQPVTRTAANAAVGCSCKSQVSPRPYKLDIGKSRNFGDGAVARIVVNDDNLRVAIAERLKARADPRQRVVSHNDD